MGRRQDDTRDMEPCRRYFSKNVSKVFSVRFAPDPQQALAVLIELVNQRPKLPFFPGKSPRPEGDNPAQVPPLKPVGDHPSHITACRKASARVRSSALINTSWIAGDHRRPYKALSCRTFALFASPTASRKFSIVDAQQVILLPEFAFESQALGNLKRRDEASCAAGKSRSTAEA